MSTTLLEEINSLRKEKNAVIMAHYYQQGEIQDLADFVGDSLALAQEAAKTNADIIIVSGVHFMGETAKILNPEKPVLVPDLDAGCSLADHCPPAEFKKFIAEYPDHEVVTYVNCSAEVKALSDLLCTSSNAVKMIDSIPKEKPILFAPDQHLGRYLIKQTGRDMVLWPGACIVHETFDEKQIIKLKVRHPEAKIIAHPECPEAILRHADHIGSTSSLLNFASTNSAKEYVVVTEAGIIHQMEKQNPDKVFYPAPPDDGCNCNECPYMKLNTLQKLKKCLTDEAPAIEIESEIIEAALKPLNRMLELS